MKTIPSLCCALIFAEALFAQSPSDISKAQTQAARDATANSSNSIAHTADGREYIVNEVKVTLNSDFALALQKAAGLGQRLDHGPMRRLHPAIESVMARHTNGRNFLNGLPLPKPIRQKPGEVPRLARMITFVLKPGFDAAKVVPELRARPEIESANLSVLYSVSLSPNDTYFANQWAPAVIGLTNAWDVPPRGNILVAIVDTGVDREHPELAGRIVNGYSFAADAPVNGDAPTDGRNAFDHGTHVAGIVAAALNNATGVAGFGNQIQLEAMGCAKWNGSIYLIANADDAINQAITDGARVVNCSFGSPGDIQSSLNDVIDEAYNHNVLIVVAAGNSSSDVSGAGGTFFSQSAVPFIISATKSDDTFDASYSNFGARVDLSAPGTGIYSTVPLNTVPPYGNKSGTSMATPMVSGAAALVMSMHPDLDDNSTKDLLIRMATDLGPPGRDTQYGWGRLFLSAPFLRVLRAADAFVTSVPNQPFGENGRYEEPWRSLPNALANVPNGTMLVLNGGIVGSPSVHYPAISITKPCTLTALPDRLVVIGQ